MSDRTPGTRPGPMTTTVFGQSGLRRLAPAPRRGPPLVARVAFAVVIVAVSFFITTSWVTRSILEERFAAVERDLVLRNRAVLARVLRAEIDNLTTTAGDWGRWDELYDFAAGTNPGFVASDLGDVVVDRLAVDLALFVAPDGSVIHRTLAPDLAGAGRHPEAAVVRAFRAAAGAAPELRPAAVAGLLDSDSGPLVLAAHPITRTDGSGPSPGTLVLARRLDATRLSTELSVLPSTVRLLGTVAGGHDPRGHALARALAGTPQGARLELRERDMSDFQLFRDFNGAPAFMLETRMERSVWTVGTETASLLISLASVGTLVALVTLILVFRQIVTVPVNRLIGHLLALQGQAPGTGQRRAPTPGRDQADEIGTLAREFEALIDARDADAVALTRLAAAIDHAADAIAVLDRYGHVAYVNARYEQQTGFRADDVIGRPPGRGPAERRRYDEIWQAVQGGDVWSGLIDTVRRDGSSATEEVTVAPIRDPDGEVTSYVAVLRDVTARRTAEAELRKLATIAEHASEGIAVLDPAGVVEYVNPAFERQRGVTLAEVRGRRPGDTDQGLDDPSVYAAIWATVGAGEAWSGRLSVRVRATGRVLTEDVVMSPVLDADGQLRNIVVILHDVTRRVALEGELAQSRKLEAVGRLAAGVAHEINTPIHYVGENVNFLAQSFACLGTLLDRVAQLAGPDGPGSVSAEVLRTLFADAEVDYLRGEIPLAIRQSLEGVDRVAEIVRSMKELAHPAEDLVVADVNAVVRSAVTMAAGQYRGVADVSLELGEGLPGVPCVPGGLNQVLINMLVNAADAVAEAHHGSGRRGQIRVSTRRAGEFIEVVVADDGVGMAPEVCERIFDPFFTTKPVGHGTGQGLAIAHRAIAKLGGEIRVASEPGRGTEFTVRLPLLPAAAPATAAARPATA